jgi:hypothetical protein
LQQLNQCAQSKPRVIMLIIMYVYIPTKLVSLFKLDDKYDGRG